MKFIQEFFEGCRVSGIYLCKHKQAAVTKNGKPYENVILQDKTGTIDAKIWDPNSLGIDDFETLDYIEIMGDVTNFAGALQLNIKRARKAREGEYDPTDYLPVSKCDIDEMYGELMAIIKTIQNPYLSRLLELFFVEDEAFIKRSQDSTPRFCGRTVGAYVKCDQTLRFLYESLPCTEPRPASDRSNLS